MKTSTGIGKVALNALNIGHRRNGNEAQILLNFSYHVSLMELLAVAPRVDVSYFKLFVL